MKHITYLDGFYEGDICSSIYLRHNLHISKIRIIYVARSYFAHLRAEVLI